MQIIINLGEALNSKNAFILDLLYKDHFKPMIHRLLSNYDLQNNCPTNEPYQVFDHAAFELYEVYISDDVIHQPKRYLTGLNSANTNNNQNHQQNITGIHVNINALIPFLPENSAYYVLERAEDNPNKEVEHGGFGSLCRVKSKHSYNALGQLTSQVYSLNNDNTETYVAKKIAINDRNPLNNLQNESELSLLVNHLHSKRAVIVYNANGEPEAGFIIMRRLKDMTLHAALTTINKDKKIPELFTVRERLLLTIRLLINFKEQILDRHIFHHDIKPSNVITSKNLLDIYFIGLGLARAMRDLRHSGGTLAFKAYEAIKKNIPYSEASELFSMAILISKIWGAKYIYEYKKSHEIKHDRQADIPVEFTDIFSNLSEKEKREIGIQINFKDVFDRNPNKQSTVTSLEAVILQNLQKMTSVNPALRGSFVTAINAFVNILYNHTLLFSTSKNPKEDANAFLAGLYCHNSLMKLNGTKLSETVDRIFETYLKQIRSVSIKQFIAMMGVQALRNCQDKQAIKTVAASIIKSFQDNINLLLHLQLSSKVYKNLLNLYNEDVVSDISNLFKMLDFDIQRLLNKKNKCIYHLDSLYEFNKKVSSQADKLAKQLKEIGIQIYSNQQLTAIHQYLNLLVNLKTTTSYQSGVSNLEQTIKRTIRHSLSHTFSSNAINKNDQITFSQFIQKLDSIIIRFNTATDAHIDEIIKGIKLDLKPFKHTAFGDALRSSIKANILMFSNPVLLPAPAAASEPAYKKQRQI